MTQFPSMMQFLQMGGYALYVWPSYALAGLVVGLNIYWARRSLRSAQRESRRRLASLQPDMKVRVSP